MSKLFVAAIVLCCLVSVPLSAEDQRLELSIALESEVLARHGDYVLTFADVDGYMRLRVPPEDRAGVLANPDRIARILDDLLLSRALAQTAIRDGMLEEEGIQAQLFHVAMSMIGEEQQRRAVAEGELDDYTAQARELYLRNPSAFRLPETFDFSHLLIHIGDRPDETAAEGRERIEALAARLDDGETLDALIEEYSEDPSAADNRGRFTGIEPDQLDPHFLSALRDLEPGQVSGPVRSRFGWHLVRLDGHQQARNAEFEDVADRLRQQARSRHREQLRTRYLESLLEGGAPAIVDGGIQRLVERYSAND